MLIRRVIGAALLMWLLLWAGLVLPELVVRADCPGNALVNPGFEEGFTDRGAGEVSIANGWFPWWQDGPGQAEGHNRRPEYKPEDANRYGTRRIRSGTFAQKQFNTYSTHHAGLYQQVQVAVASKLTFSCWVQVWSSQHHDPDSIVDPGNYRAYVGIDPTGGTDWSSPNVVWSEPHMEYNTWIRPEVQAVAKAGTITVFVRGQPEYRVKFNDSYWDDACLTVVRPTPRPTNTPKDTPTPMPTHTPEPSPTPEASPTPTNTPTPVTGRICVSVYEDANGDGKRDEGESLVAGAAISLADEQHEKVAEYITDGLNEPFCYSGLEGGTYYLKRQNAPGYVSTNPDDWGVVIIPASSINVGFGAQFVPTPSATPTTTSTTTPTVTPTPRRVLAEIGGAVHMVSGIIVAALALIIPLALRYLRERL